MWRAVHDCLSAMSQSAPPGHQQEQQQQQRRGEQRGREGGAAAGKQNHLRVFRSCMFKRGSCLPLTSIRARFSASRSRAAHAAYAALCSAVQPPASRTSIFGARAMRAARLLVARPDTAACRGVSPAGDTTLTSVRLQLMMAMAMASCWASLPATHQGGRQGQGKHCEPLQ